PGKGSHVLHPEGSGGNLPPDPGDSRRGPTPHLPVLQRRAPRGVLPRARNQAGAVGHHLQLHRLVRAEGSAAIYVGLDGAFRPTPSPCSPRSASAFPSPSSSTSFR